MSTRLPLRTLFGGGFLGALTLAALAPHLLAPEWLAAGHDLDPLHPLKAPQSGLPLGTDPFGRDPLARLVLAAPRSLAVAGFAATLAVGLGTLLGTLAAKPGLIGGALRHLADALLTLPPLVLALALVATAGASPLGLAIAIAVPELPRVMRLIRASTLTLQAEPWAEAGHALGNRRLARLRRDLLPALAPLVVVLFAQAAALALITEALIGFLGLGLPGDKPGWGTMLAEGRSLLAVRPSLTLAPAALIACTAFAAQALADGLRYRLSLRLPELPL